MAKLLPRGTCATRLNSSSSKPPLKTYSKRALQDSYKPCSKRQCIEAPIFVDSTAECGLQPNTPTLLKKRSISDYFQAIDHTSTPSTPQSSIFSSDPALKDVESPSSSPPPRHTSSSVVPQKIRIKRRLIARVPLAALRMSDINAGSSNEHRKGKGKRIASHGPFYPGSPQRTSYLTKTSPPGLRQAARGGTSSEEEENEEADEDEAYHGEDDAPRSAAIPIPASHVDPSNDYIVPFTPQPRHTFRERGSGNVHQSIADPPTGSLLTFTRRSITELGSDNLNADEPANQDLSSDAMHGPAASQENHANPPGSENGLELPTAHAARPGTGGGAPVIGNPIHAVNLTNPGISTQPHIADPSATQASINSAVPSTIQPNVPVATNVASGSGNLVQAQLVLGVPTATRCDICRMNFNHTIQQDVAAHLRYHATYIMGVPVVGLTMTDRYLVKTISTDDYIVAVDRSSAQGWKTLAMTVLEHVDKDLGSITINATRLWSTIPEPVTATTLFTSVARRVDRYKVYMYVSKYPQSHSRRVISLLLAERISTGFETSHTQLEADDFGEWPSIAANTPPVVSDNAHRAILGVNKLWTIKSNRQRGHATLLLREACKHFIPYFTIPRTDVAWTQTTEQGAKFAQRYLQDEVEQGHTDYEYLTYFED